MTLMTASKAKRKLSSEPLFVDFADHYQTIEAFKTHIHFKCYLCQGFHCLFVVKNGTKLLCEYQTILSYYLLFFRPVFQPLIALNSKQNIWQIISNNNILVQLVVLSLPSKPQLTRTEDNCQLVFNLDAKSVANHSTTTCE